MTQLGVLTLSVLGFALVWEAVLTGEDFSSAGRPWLLRGAEGKIVPMAPTAVRP
jgi:hypothetical protein